jgi:hypothetical protein
MSGFAVAPSRMARGRLAIVAAPSLPASTPLTQPALVGDRGATARQTADAIASMSVVLACRLDDEAAVSVNAEDRNACVEATRHAWALHARLS